MFSGDKEYPVFTSRFAIINQHKFWIDFMSCCWPQRQQQQQSKSVRHLYRAVMDICTGRSWTRNKLNLPATFARSKLESVPNPFVFQPSPVPLRRNEQSVKILPDSRTNIANSFDVCMMQGKRCCTFFPPSDRLLVTFKNIACFTCFTVTIRPHQTNFPKLDCKSVTIDRLLWTTCIQTFGSPCYLRGCSQPFNIWWTRHFSLQNAKPKIVPGHPVY